MWRSLSPGRVRLSESWQGVEQSQGGRGSRGPEALGIKNCSGEPPTLIKVQPAAVGRITLSHLLVPVTDSPSSVNQGGLRFHHDLLGFFQDQLRFEFSRPVGKASLTVSSSIWSLSFKHEENHFTNVGSSDVTFTEKVCYCGSISGCQP